MGGHHVLTIGEPRYMELLAAESELKRIKSLAGWQPSEQESLPVVEATCDPDGMSRAVERGRKAG